jgi:parallel beta-helix repeat protein
VVGWSGAAQAGGGQTIEVFPGPDAINNAMSQANAGDTLRLHRGRYHEALTINKAIHIVGAPGRRPVIDAGCGARDAVAVRTEGVLLRHLKVVGADSGFGVSPAEVDFSGLGQGRAVNLVLRDSCDAEYGINVLASQRIDLVGNRAVGFTDAGFYIGQISTTGSGVLRVRHNAASHNNRGAIVEDSSGGQIEVTQNSFHDNDIPGEDKPTGIFLHGSTGVLIASNDVRRNGRYGIWLDLNSDHNTLNDNVSRNNGNPIRNFKDDNHVGNCGSQNSFSIPACP